VPTSVGKGLGMAALSLRHDSPGLLGGVGLSLHRPSPLLLSHLASLEHQAPLFQDLRLSVLVAGLLLIELPHKVVYPLLFRGDLGGPFGEDLLSCFDPRSGNFSSKCLLAGFCRERPLDRYTVGRIAIGLAHGLSHSKLRRQSTMRAAWMAAG